MAPSSHLAYQQSFKGFGRILQLQQLTLQLAFRQKSDQPLLAHLILSRKSLSTANTHLAWISTKHKSNGWEDPTKSFLVKEFLKGFCSISSPKRHTLSNYLSKSVETDSQYAQIYMKHCCLQWYSRQLFLEFPDQ